MKEMTESSEKVKLRHLTSGAFLTIFCSASLLISTIQLIRAGNISENYDKVLFISVILLGFYYSLSRFKPTTKLKSPSLILIIFGLVIMIIGITSLENHTAISQEYLQKLWRGFGLPVLILCVLLIPIIFQIYAWKSFNKFLRLAFGLIATILIALSLLAVFQRDDSIIDLYHSEYVINEIYAIPSGNIPYVDFIPQYGLFYSEIIFLFSKLISVPVTINLVLLFISIGTMTAIAIAIYLVYKSLNKSSLALATLLVLPFTSITKFPGRTDFPGNIFDLISAVPIRILPGLVIGALLINILNAGRKVEIWKTWLIGTLAGVLFWLNQDFSVVAAFLSIFYLMVLGDFKKRFIHLISAFILGLASYPLVASQFGEFRFNSVGFFALQYTSGYMAEPIQTPGPVLVILPLIIALFFASTTPLVLERFKKYTVEPEYRRALITASFFSCWSLIGFAYYLNRSYASGQMQILFLPLSVASASYFYYLFPKVESIPWGVKDFFRKRIWAKSNLRYQIPNLSLAILMALPIATIVAFPNPQIELKRLTNAPIGNKWPNMALDDAMKRYQQIADSNPIIIEDLAYFGNAGNYFEYETGVKSANILNSPIDITPAKVPLETGCSYLRLVDAKYLLIDENGLAVKNAFGDRGLCDLYDFADANFGMGNYLLERRSK